ncbi:MULTISPECIES: DUF5381 family protein [Bacillaceae]|jgi:hypothetical protein|uniref:DUF5381 family protein n=1 Tax=Bacillaceae TaxID=186817 RepID=UPI0011A507AD|nr:MULTISPECIES: DUF5381 family protein [Bacillaceae]MCM3123042.1 YfjD family protein [Mesobacillus sp. MER 33]MCM3233475.1 YfjD family protein [Mesobacillus sp. MER 48]
MENKIEENNIKIYDDRVEVVYTSGGVGCMLTGGGIMFLASLFILFYIVPTSGFVRAFIGVIIGGFGALFIGMVLFKVVGALLTGKAVYTVQDGYFKGKNKAVKIDEITDMKWAGSSLKYLAIKTTNRKTVKLSSYNLVPEEKVNQVINDYVIPNATPEFKENWNKRMSNKGA